MESKRYLFHRLFPMALPEDPGSMEQGLLLVVCLAMEIDGKISSEEMVDATHLIKQMYAFEEYESGEEIRELLEETIAHVTNMGPELTIEQACDLLPGTEERELALQLIAYINDSDQRVVPIEVALIDLAAKKFGIESERVMELLQELDANVSRTREQLDRESSPQTAENNPFLAYEGLPRFEEVEAWQLEPAVKTLLPELREELARLEALEGASFDAVIHPYQELSERIGFTWSLAGHLLAVRNEDALRAAYERVQPELVAFSIEMGQSRALYEKFLAIQADASLDEVQRRIIDALVLSAQHSGVGLEGEKKERFNAIQASLAKLSTTFGNNVLDSTKAFEVLITDRARIDGLEPSFLKMAAQSARQAGHMDATAEDGPWRITLDVPSAFPVLKDARDRSLREEVYRAYTTRASQGDQDNTAIIMEILRLRKEEADILGYDNFASLSLSTKMAQSVERVESLLNELRSASWDAAEQDHAELLEFARQNGFDGELEHWDLNFWSERLREERYGYKTEEIKPYFPFPRVLSGFFLLVKELFGVRVVPADLDEGIEVWHEDVKFYNVYEGDTHIASFFLDPYSRPATKRGGAWHSTCKSRHVNAAGDLQIPISYLICNQTPPVDGQPSLMTFGEVTTLFHEFGHGLQHMLTGVDYALASGISNVEWDAVELPSQFMENWCYQPEILQSLTGHVESGEPLPQEYLDKIIAAKNFRAGSAMLRQLYFGLLDMTLHHNYDAADASAPSIFDVQQEISKKTSVMAPSPENRFLCSFSHIFAGGYAAGYYSYKWAEVLSADAFAAFEEAGLNDPDAIQETGRRFRETVLALGGGRAPMGVFKDFRGREPSPDALLRHNGLVEEAR